MFKFKKLMQDNIPDSWIISVSENALIKPTSEKSQFSLKTPPQQTETN